METEVPTLTPTPIRNPRPPLLATPPGFPPPFLPQGIHQSSMIPKPGQKPTSPVQTNLSPDKVSPNKSPPQLPQTSKGFNPNAPTFVPMGLPAVQRPPNPPTSSILGAPPITKLTNFGPPVGSSILGNAPPLGGPRMVGPNIIPGPQPPPPPPPTCSQTSILGQPPAPSINPHIFNAPPMPPGQQNFPPKPPNQAMYGQFDGNQPPSGVMPPFNPFGINLVPFQGVPGPGQSFVGQPNQNFAGPHPKEHHGSLDGPMPFLPNHLSQQMMGPGPGPGPMLPPGSSEMSKFGIPLLNMCKTEQDLSEGGPGMPLPSMLIPSDGGSFDSPRLQMVRGNLFNMGLPQQHPGSGRVTHAETISTSNHPTGKEPPSLLGNFSNTNLDLFPSFLPIGDRGSGTVEDPAHSTLMMVPPSVFPPPSIPPPPSNSTPHEASSDGLLPIGTERAQRGSLASSTSASSSSVTAAAGSASGSSFPMLAPGINPSSVWSYSGGLGSSEDSDWSHQVGGAPFEVAVWPSIKTSRGGVRGSVAVATQETLAAVLARVGLTQHMDLFQSNEIDLDALLLMSEKDFSEIGLPQAAQIKLLNALGRKAVKDNLTTDLNQSPNVAMVTIQSSELEVSGSIHGNHQQDPFIA